MKEECFLSTMSYAMPTCFKNTFLSEFMGDLAPLTFAVPRGCTGTHTLIKINVSQSIFKSHL